MEWIPCDQRIVLSWVEDGDEQVVEVLFEDILDISLNRLLEHYYNRRFLCRRKKMQEVLIKMVMKEYHEDPGGIPEEDRDGEKV